MIVSGCLQKDEYGHCWDNNSVLRKFLKSLSMYCNFRTHKIETTIYFT